MSYHDIQCPICYELYCVCNNVHQDHLRMAIKSVNLSETFHSKCTVSQVVTEPIIYIPDGEIDIEMFLQQIEDVLGPVSDDDSDSCCSGVDYGDDNDDDGGYDDDDLEMADLTEDEETENARSMRH
ncbi:hypothetical protein BGZ73_007052 [Actinomortierella ambigua]|nr:hypothetical protein BGZ73_007052 [Actinomortierella ambigua]